MTRLGVIGCGRIVEDAHAPALLRIGELVKVVALADPAKERRAAVAHALGSAPAEYDGWQEMLADRSQLEAVLVAVPHHLHSPAIIAAAKAGVDVISEKPLAPALTEIDQIKAAVEHAGVRLAVIHNWAYLPPQRAGLAAVRGGLIGDVFLVRAERLLGTPYRSRDPNTPDWRLRSATAGGGALLDNGYHDVYLAEAMTGSPIARVYAAVGRFARDHDVDDTAVVLMTHANGATTVLQAGWSVEGGSTLVHEVHGDAGSIRFEQPPYAVLHAILLGRFEEVRALSAQLPDHPPAEIYENTKGEWRPLLSPDQAGGMVDAMEGALADILLAWNNGEPAPNGLEAARHVVEVIRAAYTSAENAQPVVVGSEPS
jgi:predicted dehydrogenase